MLAGFAAVALSAVLLLLPAQALLAFWNDAFVYNFTYVSYDLGSRIEDLQKVLDFILTTGFLSLRCSAGCSPCCMPF